MAADVSVSIRNVVRRFAEVTAVDRVSLDVARGEFVSLLGPSGCGKTTLLRIVAGLEHADQGEVWIDGVEISRRPAHKRPVGLVFQRYALFPHKTVGENIAFSLGLRKVGKEEIRRRVASMLELVRLPNFADRRIEQLSGGQAQRVALARALVNDPPVLLLDEPLAALDLKLRQAMHIELREIQRRVGSTFVYVTHDQEEALVMSDRVVLMNNGRIIQQGPPLEVYENPETLFASTFLGEANLVRGPARRTRDGLRVDADGISILTSSAPDEVADDQAWVCIRPERIEIRRRAGGERTANSAEGTVSQVIFLGSIVRYVVGVAGGAREIVVEKPVTDSARSFKEGDAVSLAWERQATRVVRED